MLAVFCLSSPFCLILTHFFYHYFCRFSKISFGRVSGVGDNNKYTSWQTCVCAKRFLEGCLIILTMRKLELELKASFVVILSVCICETVKHW